MLREQKMCELLRCIEMCCMFLWVFVQSGHQELLVVVGGVLFAFGYWLCCAPRRRGWKVVKIWSSSSPSSSSASPSRVRLGLSLFGQIIWKTFVFITRIADPTRNAHRDTQPSRAAPDLQTTFTRCFHESGPFHLPVRDPNPLYHTFQHCTS